MTSPDPASTLQQPQFWSSYPARLREGSTALLQTTAVSARPIRRAAQRETNIMAFDSDDEEFERQLGSMASTITLPSQQTTAPKQLAKKAVRPTNHAYPSEEELCEQAEKQEILVPIRLEIEQESFRIKDCFLWNLTEELISPERFAEIFCEDVDLPIPVYAQPIAAAIRSQLTEHRQLLELQASPLNESQEEHRVVIHLDIHVGQLYLRDRFEWDLFSNHSPEAFAKQLTADLGLGGEFIVLIAISIREQLQRKLRERLFGDIDEDAAKPFPSGGSKFRLDHAFRRFEDAEDWSPAVEQLTPDELERLTADKERSNRRQRREASRYLVRPRTALLPSATGTPRSSDTPFTNTVDKLKRKRGEGKTTTLTEEEALGWRCSHCWMDARGETLVRRGPEGPKTLCNSCGLHWQAKGQLPFHRKDKYK